MGTSCAERALNVFKVLRDQERTEEAFKAIAVTDNNWGSVCYAIKYYSPENFMGWLCFPDLSELKFVKYTRTIYSGKETRSENDYAVTIPL